MEQRKMKRYEELKQNALGIPIYEDIKKLGFSIDGDRLGESVFAGPKMDLCWLLVGHDPCRICGIWFGVYFMKYKIVSRNCFNCWKIVVRMDSIKDLYKILELQKKHLETQGIASKCGKEERPYCSLKGRYAAFWYGPMRGNCGLKEAKEMAQIVKMDLEKELPHLADKVIVKRGCTEMEMSIGPSTLWEYPDEQHEFEDKLDQLFKPATTEDIQPPWLQELIEFAWLEHGINTRDPDIGEYVDNPARYRNTIQTVDYLANDNIKILSRYVKKGRINCGNNRIEGQEQKSGDIKQGIQLI